WSRGASHLSLSGASPQTPRRRRASNSATSSSRAVRPIVLPSNRSTGRAYGGCQPGSSVIRIRSATSRRLLKVCSTSDIPCLPHDALDRLGQAGETVDRSVEVGPQVEVLGEGSSLGSSD